MIRDVDCTPASIYVALIVSSTCVVEQLSFETGKIGRQAGGAVMARDGDTVVYSTACIDKVFAWKRHND